MRKRTVRYRWSCTLYTVLARVTLDACGSCRVALYAKGSFRQPVFDKPDFSGHISAREAARTSLELNVME